jgi:uncharacterized protein involved in exopolysaccharide biosynthesis
MNTPERVTESIPGSDQQISLIDLLAVLIGKVWILVFVPLALGVVALGIAFVIPPTFTARTVLLPPQQQQSAAASMLAGLGSLGGVAGVAAGLKNPVDQYLSFLKTTSVEDAIIDRFGLQERYGARFKVDARKALRLNVRISAGKDGLISIEFDDRDPHFAASVANGYVEEFSKLLARLAVTEAQRRRLFFEDQLQKTKANLLRAEQDLRLSGVTSASLKSLPNSALAGVATMKAQITAQEVKVASMRGYLADSAPELQRALMELGALRNQLSRQDRDESALAESGGGKEYIGRFREFKYHETLFELYSRQYELARIDEAREGAVVQVIDKALPPEQRSKPRRGMIAIATTLISGLLLLVFFIVRAVIRHSRSQGGDDAQWAALERAWKGVFSFRSKQSAS